MKEKTELTEKSNQKYLSPVDARIGERNNMNDILFIIGIGIVLVYNAVCLYYIRKVLQTLKKME